MASPEGSPAKAAGDQFKHQYYYLLQNSPELLHKFYKDHSKIVRPGLDGKMRASTLSDVDDRDLNVLSSGDFDSVEVTSVTSQDSLGGGIFLVVGGYFTLNERPARSFIQTFFLAPQEIGYFVLTDMLRFVDISTATFPPANNVIEEKVPETKEVADESLRVSEPNDGLEDVSKISYASVVMKGKPIGGQGQHSSSCDHSPEIQAADAVDDTKNGNNQGSQAVTEESCIFIKNFPKNATIASVENAFKQFGEIRRGGIKVIRNKMNCWYGIVKFEEADAAKRAIKAAPMMFEGRTIYVEKKLPRYKSESVGPSIVHKAPVLFGSEPGPHSSSCDHSPEIKADAVDDSGNENSQEYYQTVNEEACIYVKNLPPHATIGLVENAFKQFGAIKKGGIRVRSNLGSQHWYGFVEFEEADAAKRAIKASPVEIDGQHVLVEKMKKLVERPRKYFQEEQGREDNQNRYRSEEMRGVGQIVEEEEEENQNWENLPEEQRKIQEEGGRQYNQNRCISELMKETQGVGQIPEEEEEEEENQK